MTHLDIVESKRALHDDRYDASRLGVRHDREHESVLRIYRNERRGRLRALGLRDEHAFCVRLEPTQAVFRDRKVAESRHGMLGTHLRLGSAASRFMIQKIDRGPLARDVVDQCLQH